ncbi:hypothetical protein COU54_04850 [Candidatus Pacearchaeota archaeon CG10_big_fil_rev_8_21_14_0_10_31_24]|nr:MAG: hypothetical protein COU54_04850 [Candidatus Pacearchaeota archaeon CG10_big_fil_rev_8_21_14_0_10_31_24]
MKLENRYSEEVIERGEGYLNSVKYCIKIDNFIYGKVEGSTIYKTEVDLRSLEGDCSCPYSTNCKHAVALYLNYQKGKFGEDKHFMESLNKMSNNELKELILSKLQENPDWIIKHNLRKNANTKDFLKDFKRSFSSDKINEAEAILLDLSFDKLLELQDYISENYDDLAEKLGEEMENSDYVYDSWDEENYDEELYDLNEKLVEMIVKKSLENGKVKEVVKRVDLRDEIIKNSGSFLKYKEKIKLGFTKNEYLRFLLNLKNPDVIEIKKYVNNENREFLYKIIDEKTELIKNVAISLKDNTLIWSVAVHENDFNTIIHNFNQFEMALKEDYSLKEKLNEVVDLFIKNKFRNEEIARKLLLEYEDSKYDNKQIKYLASQIKDYEFIKSNFNKDKIETHIELLERMSEIDKKATFRFIKSKKDLLNRHWSYIIPLFNFLRKNHSLEEIKKYVGENQDFFKTSSHLKKHLKEECGIFISLKEDKISVEIK